MKKSMEENLREAAARGDFQSVEGLLAALNPKKDRAMLDRAAWEAVTHGHTGIVGRLLQAGASAEGRNASGSLLLQAATLGHLDLVRLLVDSGARPNRKFYGMTACSEAVENERWAVVDYLKSKGADWAIPMLFYGAEHGDLKRIEEGLAGGADINCIGRDPKETALMAAATQGQAEAIRFLLWKGADPHKRVGGMTALYCAAWIGKNSAAVEALLEAGVEVEAAFDGETALMAAAGRGDLETVKLMIDHGAKVAARNKQRAMTVFDYARQGKNRQVIALLEKFDVSSEREPSLKLAKALAKVFGGKPIEVTGSGGLFTSHASLRSAVAGFRCEFDIGAEGFFVWFRKLRFRSKLFGSGKDESFALHARPPAGGDRGFLEVPLASHELGQPVFRRKGGNSPADEALIKFSRGNREAVAGLAFKGKEFIQFWPGGMRMLCLTTDWAKVKAKLDVLGRFLTANFRAPEPEQRLFPGEWLLKPASKASSPMARHQLGGELATPVACPHCGGVSHLMARVNLADPMLPASPLGCRDLPVFWCLDCLEWDPRFFDLSGKSPLPLDSSGKPFAKLAGEAAEASLTKVSATLVPVPTSKKAGRKSKLGGGPSWVQSEEVPDCPKCAKAMTFALQLASDTRIAYADMGVLYSFVCPDCQISASLVQSH